MIVLYAYKLPALALAVCGAGAWSLLHVGVVCQLGGGGAEGAVGCGKQPSGAGRISLLAEMSSVTEPGWILPKW